jgi:HEAT repeats
MNETVLVFEDPVKDADIRQEELSTIAWQHDWELCKIEKRGEHNPFLKAWLTQNEETGITYIENHLVNVPYIVIRGKNQEQVAKALSASFCFYDVDKLCNFIHSDPKDKSQLARAICLFGIAVGEEKFNANYFSCFEFCLSHPNSDVRRAAMLAVSGVGWPEFKSILERIRDNDPDLELRNYATTTLESMQIHLWNSQAA